MGFAAAGGFLPPVIAEILAKTDQFTAEMSKARAEMVKTADSGASSYSKLATVGKAAFLGLAVAAIGIGVTSVKLASDFEGAHARMLTAIKNTGGSFDAFSSQIGSTDQRMQHLGFSQTETESGLARLINAAHGTGKALGLMSLTADIARGRNISFAAATDLLTKVEVGHVALLGRIGINTKDAEGKTISITQAVQRLGEMYGGSAARYSDTFAGKMKTLEATAQNLGIRIGEWLIPKLEALATGMAATVEWFDRNRVVASALGAIVAGPLLAAMGAFIAMKVTSTVESIWKAMTVQVAVTDDLAASDGAATVATGALIVAEEGETVAAGEAAAATTALALSTVGLIGVWAGTAVAGIALGKTLLDLAGITGSWGTKQGIDVGGAMDKFTGGLLKSASNAKDAQSAINGLGTSTAAWLQSLGAAREQTNLGFIRNMGLSYDQVIKVLKGGRPAIDDFTLSLGGTVRNQDLARHGMDRLYDSLQKSSGEWVKNAISTDKVNPVLAKAAIHMNTMRDGTVNWIAVIKQLSTQQGLEATASGNLSQELELQKQHYTSLTTAIYASVDAHRAAEEGTISLVQGSITAKQNVLALGDAWKTYQGFVKKGTQGTEDGKKALYDYQQQAYGNAGFLKSQQDAAEKTAAGTSGLTDALKAQAKVEASAKSTESQKRAATDAVAAAQERYRANLIQLAGTVDGPVHDALLQLLHDTVVIDPKAKALADHTIAQTIASVGLKSALADQALSYKVSGKNSDDYRASTAAVIEKQIALKQKLTDLANAASGPVKQAILDYIHNALGKVPAHVPTALELAGVPAAEQTIATYLLKIGAIPPNKITNLEILGVAAALHSLGLLDAAVRKINPNVSLVAVNRAEGGRSSAVPPTAVGGVFTTPQMRLIGEAGAEAVVPLTNPARARAVMEQAGLVGVESVASYGRASSSSASPVIVNIDASGAVGLDLDKLGRVTYDALHRISQRNGGLKLRIHPS